MENLSHRQFLASTIAAGMPDSIPSPPISGRRDLAMAAAVCAVRRVETAFYGQASMAHPMHVLGCRFQVGMVNRRRSEVRRAIPCWLRRAALSPRSPPSHTKSLWSSLLASEPTKPLIDT